MNAPLRDLSVEKLESLVEPAGPFSGSYPDLLESYRDLLSDATQESARQAEPAEVAAKREQIASLSTTQPQLAIEGSSSAAVVTAFGPHLVTS